MIAIVGSDGVGKTSLMEKLSNDAPIEVRSYLGKHLYRKSLLYKLIVAIFRPLPTKYRLAYEWDAYRQLHPAGLSPEPIWHGKDAAMSSHVDWPRVSVQLIADQSRYWPIMERVLPAIQNMHDLGVVHMDLNLGNILADENSDSVMFIDFEYAAVAGLTRGQQKAFDYLHVIRNTTRRRRGGNMLRADTDRMAKLLDSCLDDETRNAELDFSPNTIDKIDEVPGLKDSLKKVFTKL